MELVLEIFLFLLGLYFFLGIIFSIPFILYGIGIVDHDAKKMSVGTRFILWPGTIVFWLLLLFKWIEKRNHDDTQTQKKA